ncbi:relaxase/mobilization nuclease domain-containing protein [Brytella acorum]
MTVKARIVRHAGKGGGAAAHLRYIQRDGTSRDGARGILYGAETDRADAPAFLERGTDDRHQFRMIVSPEDADRMSDLTGFTRDLMRQMEADLGTKLDWVAVNHHNTAHPHVHVVVNGRDDLGENLVIDGTYIGQGIRERASELATLELGPVTEIEQRRKLEAEVSQDRFTRLDRALLEQAQDGMIDMRPGVDMAAGNGVDRSLRLSRLAKLERMGLASQTEPGRWELDEHLEDRLRALGEQGDITKQMHRALKARGPDQVRDPGSFRLHGETPDAPIVGRLIDRHLTDELGEKLSLVVDGIDGRVHHVPGFDPAQVADIRNGAIVAIGSARERGPRPSDRAILAHAEDGLYRVSAHLERMRLEPWTVKGDPEELMKGYVRRLEALRRGGIVERQDADRWRLPEDFQQRAAAYDAARSPKATIRLLSSLDLEAQIGSDGATWLDRRLVAGRDGDRDRAEAGFGREVGEAMSRRQDRLMERGDAVRDPDGAIRYRRNLLATLEAREVEHVGQAMAERKGLSWHRMGPFESVSGTLSGPVHLASASYALIENAHEFALVPWRPEIGRHRQKDITMSMSEDGALSWEIGRSRGLGL